MAWRLTFDVVIEGIETFRQEEILKEIEIELKQGNMEISITRQGYLVNRFPRRKLFRY